MTVLFVLKYLADTAYYMIYAAFAAGRMGAGTLVLQALALVLVSLLCRLAAGRTQDRPLRLLPLALLPLLLLLPGGWRAALLSLPPALYLGWTVWQRLFVPERGDAVDSFLLLSKVLPAPLLLAVLFGGGETVRSHSFPYILLYLFCYVLLLRMLRHDEEVLRQRRFRVLNTLELCAALLAASALFSRQFRGAVAAAASLLYNYIIAPVLMLVSYLFVALGWLLSKILKPLDMSQREDPPLFETGEEELENLVEQQVGEGSELLYRLLIALAVIAVCVLLFLLFRRLLNRRRTVRETAGRESREAVDAPARGAKPLRRFGLRTPAEQVRYQYRKYLLLARSRGAALTECQNTLQQRRQAGEYLRAQDPQDALRALYLPARYGGEADKAAAREAKRLYEEIKAGTASE